MSRITPRPIPPEGLSKPKRAEKAHKPMRKVSPKKEAYRASGEGRKAREYVGHVKALACCVCGRPGPSDAHHPFCGRYGTKRVSDFDVIPLCEFCHRYPHANAIHTNKSAWAARNGPDYGFIEQTRKLVEAAHTIDF